MAEAAEATKPPVSFRIGRQLDQEKIDVLTKRVDVRIDVPITCADNFKTNHVRFPKGFGYEQCPAALKCRPQWQGHTRHRPVLPGQCRRHPWCAL